jgi:hypothetical protein
VTEDLDLLQLAKDGARAVENNDGGRSRYLIEQVAELMASLTTTEAEWLSVAVTNGAMARQFNESPIQVDDFAVTQTPDGEKWDI